MNKTRTCVVPYCDAEFTPDPHGAFSERHLCPLHRAITEAEKYAQRNLEAPAGTPEHRGCCGMCGKPLDADGRCLEQHGRTV